MNIQAQLFKIYNKARYNAEHWGKMLEESDRNMENGKEPNEMDGEVFYNAVFYEGASFFGKIFLNTYQGDFTDAEIEHWIKRLDKPRDEARVV